MERSREDLRSIIELPNGKLPRLAGDMRTVPALPNPLYYARPCGACNAAVFRSLSKPGADGPGSEECIGCGKTRPVFG